MDWQRHQWSRCSGVFFFLLIVHSTLRNSQGPCALSVAWYRDAVSSGRFHEVTCREFFWKRWQTDVLDIKCSSDRTMKLWSVILTAFLNSASWTGYFSLQRNSSDLLYSTWSLQLLSGPNWCDASFTAVKLICRKSEVWLTKFIRWMCLHT